MRVLEIVKMEEFTGGSCRVSFALREKLNTKTVTLLLNADTNAVLKEEIAPVVVNTLAEAGAIITLAPGEARTLAHVQERIDSEKWSVLLDADVTRQLIPTPQPVDVTPAEKVLEFKKG